MIGGQASSAGDGEFRSGIGEIEALVRQAEQTGKAVDLSLPMAADIARYMNAEIGDPYQNIIPPDDGLARIHRLGRWVT